MSQQSRNRKQLLLLVGSNPLPNFLVALILKPQSICLFYSPETETVKDYLYNSLKSRCDNVSDRCIRDATDPFKVREAFDSISRDAHLNYTGGTKIMAAHARWAFRDAGGADSQASYLDERNSVLRFDDGYSINISQQDFEVTIDEILGLHGISRIPAGAQPKTEPNDQDVKRVVESVIDNPGLASKLYGIHRKNDGNLQAVSKAKQDPLDLNHFVSGLSIQQLPEHDWTKDTYKRWCKFLGGDWLEQWCGSLVRDITQASGVIVGIDCQRTNTRRFEIDVAFVRGCKLYVISCTTHTKMPLCKSKLFEVAIRARQLGGDLARSALVCLLHGSNDDGDYVHQLRYDAADIWKASNTPSVFGLDDLREWAGINGPADVGGLKKWIES
ncbi:hypothetical protein CR161_09395 [Prosthecochloris sp. ZM]|uniref:Card1-like endonuclease domain-containing protein n=1 Tax=Prosthecochloris sp. ZM TaxID=2283143 RepID=UPI000DF80056|nr:DUF1887 family CARF protein [Prosthecochloris sp. ZM]RDD30896.1 hypothetical protein CR161_09395 [Prosthecochloris sp. ZM]